MEDEIVYQLTLEWTEAEQHRSQTLSSDLSKLVTIGRDPDCDVVLNDQARSVSGVHAGLYFDPKSLSFHIRNLTRDRLPPKQPNPIWINGQKVIQEELSIAPNSQIQLGRMVLKVKSVEAVMKDRGITLSRGSLDALKVKCSRLQNPHYLPPEYQGQNCPYCGHLVLSASLVMPPPEPPKAAVNGQTPSAQPKSNPNPSRAQPRPGEPLISRLDIQIDEQKRQKQVNSILRADFFQKLLEKSKKYRDPESDISDTSDPPHHSK
ncbi:MAG: FHA domain-containing protein [Thermostichus sp. DG02_5_bins_236]